MPFSAGALPHLPHPLYRLFHHLHAQRIDGRDRLLPAWHPLSFSNGCGGGGIHPHALAGAAIRLHPRSLVLSDHRRHSPLSDPPGIRDSGADGDPRKRHPPPSGHDELPDTSRAYPAGLYRSHFRYRHHRGDRRPHPLRLPPAVYRTVNAERKG